jgi:hypothetical protein
MWMRAVVDPFDLSELPPDAAVARLSEDEDLAGGNGSWLLGTFSGHAESGNGEPLGAIARAPALRAIAWARDRADYVRLVTGDREVYSAGTRHPAGAMVWPELELTRRRPPDLASLDRLPDDPPIAWQLEVWLRPPSLDPALRPAFDDVVRQFASAAGAESWDARSFDAYLTDVESAQRCHPTGVWTHNQPLYRVKLIARAATRSQATEEARSRLTAPDGWWLFLEEFACTPVSETSGEVH